MNFVAGTGRVEMTPDPAMLNWVDLKPYDGVLDPLFVRALFLSDGTCSIVMLCWDLVDVVDETAVRVRRAIHEATDVPESHIMIVASHTHSGPRCPFSEKAVIAGRLDRLRDLLDDPVFLTWSEELPGLCAEAARNAKDAAVPVFPSIGRANAAEWLFNRRPVDPDGNVVTTFIPEDPYVLPDGLRFGPMDPTLTVLSLRNADEKAVATAFSVPCHAVAVYGAHRGVSADWPGVACEQIAESLGGEALFLQGCAGDLVPASRGLDAREEMAHFFADRTMAAAKRDFPLSHRGLRMISAQARFLVTSDMRERLGADTLPAEIQVVAFGDFALVALPHNPYRKDGAAMIEEGRLVVVVAFGDDVKRREVKFSIGEVWMWLG